MVFMKFQIEFPSAFLLTNRHIVFAIGLFLAVHSQSLFAQEKARNAGTKSSTQNVLELKPEHGPWLVFATSFDGPDARSQAEQLATELRRDFKLQAYCMVKKLDLTQPLVGAGVDPKGNNRKYKFREKKMVDGYAVLVGDFDEIDSPAIAEALTKVKTINPKSVRSEESDQQDLTASNSVSVSSWRQFLSKSIKSPDKPGPMALAFTTRNPLLPVDFYKTPEVDKFIKKLNEQREYSEFNLLQCPGKFSVRVAVFSGEDKAVGSWGRSSGSESADEQKVSQLVLAAERATLTARALRQAGYEAYQFHDRTQSIVTVGSFNELGKNDQRNNFAYDPAIQAIVARFGAAPQPTRSVYGVTQTPRLLYDLVNQKQIPELNEGDEKSKLRWFVKHSVAFDLKPLPMAVPKAASSIYSGSLLGKDRR